MAHSCRLGCSYGRQGAPGAEESRAMTEPVWVILPVMAGIELTRAAISDILAQSVPVRLLLVNQGCPDVMREEFERISEADERVQVWSHQPSLPSLSATWNRALDFVWEAGGAEALVV